MSARQGSLVLFLVALLGCGGAGPDRYEISGTVTHQGQPAPAGQVTLEPDTSQNNQGPGAFGVIVNGQYRTHFERGAVGGPHRVTIVGYNAAPGTIPDDQLRTLFPTYHTVVDLPHASTVINFDIP